MGHLRLEIDLDQLARLLAIPEDNAVTGMRVSEDMTRLFIDTESPAAPEADLAFMGHEPRRARLIRPTRLKLYVTREVIDERMIDQTRTTANYAPND